ncbi:MAG: alpha/beta hydrolase [Bacillales bacterium]|jgi:pimeloyl-ACP methyl ester carboxylesterase|nr:alpha/beta hydrolase [Bacillales bacterium]
MLDNYLKINQCTLHYQIYGELNKGIPLVLLHGNKESIAIFQKQIAYYSSTNIVIAIDSPGHGLSSYLNPLTINNMALHIGLLLKALPYSKYNLLGFSDGGNIALIIAQDLEIINSLIIIGANLYPKGIKTFYYLSLLFTSLFMKNDYLNLMLKEPHISIEELKRITCPTLIIYGQHDMIKTKHLQLIHQNIQNSILKIIPQGNHFSFFKKTDILNDFLKTLEKTI